MPNLGAPEIIIIILVIVVLFGWKKLPDAARSLGRSMRIFKAEVEEMKDKPSAAGRETVPGEARRETRTETRTETVPPEDHRGPATETHTTVREERIVEDTPRTDGPRTDGRRDGDQYRPPMA
ncbi:Sec-independent protein translocase subunit TatA [Mobilicoccus sp.]|uniref:Sec-independent protein translocase subunit TatA n=1 Tax=Mobilicoccus sp. TaxID=2034349 RepID=UPI00289F1CDD|nr:Sec-independent protein translocase subunit TatA [Mobilicoccus sp.]